MFWKKKKEVCYHTWRVIDFTPHQGFMGDIEDYYDLGCSKCNETKVVSEGSFEKTMIRGLIKRSSHRGEGNEN